uniref:Store-operated calcium entry-associated regulatory factor n=1 Tax=Dermatophagoides pteronyssinus TaxID=6956 RepID=A0A6P6Y3Z8_DERPT|nr:store-operated calcium entry-associated regulatory factor-like [Dermatophagoides pteronyssinus]
MINHHSMLLVYSINLIVIVMAQPNDRILLENIDALTFESDRLAKTRRNQKIPQLKCIGGGNCNRVKLEVAQCFNVGSNQSIEWECRGDMPSKYKLVQVNMSCEGYDSPQDQYILADSCALQYSIAKRSDAVDDDDDDDNNNNDNDDNEISSITITIMVALFILLFGCCLCYRTNPNPNVKPAQPKSLERSKSDRKGQNSSESFGGSVMGSNQNATISPNSNIDRTSSLSLSLQ